MKLEINLKGRDDAEAIGATGAIKKENHSKLKLPDLGKLEDQATTPLADKFTLLSLGDKNEQLADAPLPDKFTLLSLGDKNEQLVYAYNITTRLVETNGTSTSIETTAYFIPEADIRLFSPQDYFNKSGSFVMDSIGTMLTLPNQLSLYFDYHKGNNLPMATSVPSDMVAAVCMAFDAFQVKMFQALLLKNKIKTSLKCKRIYFNGTGN